MRTRAEMLDSLRRASQTIMVSTPTRETSFIEMFENGRRIAMPQIVSAPTAEPRWVPLSNYIENDEMTFERAQLFEHQREDIRNMSEAYDLLEPNVTEIKIVKRSMFFANVNNLPQSVDRSDLPYKTNDYIATQYAQHIQNIRHNILFSSMKTFQFLSDGSFSAGLCNSSRISINHKYKCPFDYRIEASYKTEEEELTPFFVSKNIKRYRCETYCAVRSSAEDINQEKMDSFFNPFANVLLSEYGTKKVIQIMKDFRLKI